MGGGREGEAHGPGHGADVDPDLVAGVEFGVDQVVRSLERRVVVVDVLDDEALGFRAQEVPKVRFELSRERPGVLDVRRATDRTLEENYAIDAQPIANERRDEPVVIEADRHDVGLHGRDVGVALTQTTSLTTAQSHIIRVCACHLSLNEVTYGSTHRSQDGAISDKHRPAGQFLPANQLNPGGLKGRGALGEPRRRKHCRAQRARSAQRAAGVESAEGFLRFRAPYDLLSEHYLLVEHQVNILIPSNILSLENFPKVILRLHSDMPFQLARRLYPSHTDLLHLVDL